jgi:hypothetical protein
LSFAFELFWVRLGVAETVCALRWTLAHVWGSRSGLFEPLALGVDVILSGRCTPGDNTRALAPLKLFEMARDPLVF